MTPTIIILYQVISIVAIGYLLRADSKSPNIRSSFVELIKLGLISLGMAVVAYVATYSHWLVIQLAAWSLFLHMPLYLLRMAFLFRRTQILISALAVIFVIIISVTAVYSFLIEPYNLEIRRYTLTSNKITKPIKIGVIADLQTDNPGAFESGVLKILMDEKPNLILFPGDYVQDNDPVKFAHLQSRLDAMLIEAGITASLGAYAVEGDQELKHTTFWERAFINTEIITYPATTTFEAGELIITALSFFDSDQLNTTIPVSDKYHIVFGHRPDFALSSFDSDLLIAGHTHGGQVQLPFIGPLVTASRVPRAWADGLTEISNDRTLIVSRGIGMERDDAPRLRFLCRPEITFIELQPSE